MTLTGFFNCVSCGKLHMYSGTMLLGSKCSCGEELDKAFFQ